MTFQNKAANQAAQAKLCLNIAGGWVDAPDKTGGDNTNKKDVQSAV